MGYTASCPDCGLPVVWWERPRRQVEVKGRIVELPAQGLYREVNPPDQDWPGPPHRCDEAEKERRRAAARALPPEPSLTKLADFLPQYRRDPKPDVKPDTQADLNADTKSDMPATVQTVDLSILRGHE